MRRTLIALMAAMLAWPTIASATENPVTRHAWPPVYRFDPTLAVEYGNLINLAYEMNEFTVPPHEYTPPYSGLPPPNTGLPSAYNFIAWIRMTDFTPRGKSRRKFYGFIAQRKSDPSTFILVLRGTQYNSAVEWFDDLTSVVPVTRRNLPGKVGDGFARIFESMEVIGLDGKPTDEFGHGFADEVFAATSRKLSRGAFMAVMRCPDPTPTSTATRFTALFAQPRTRPAKRRFAMTARTASRATIPVRARTTAAWLSGNEIQTTARPLRWKSS